MHLWIWALLAAIITTGSVLAQDAEDLDFVDRDNWLREVKLTKDVDAVLKDHTEVTDIRNFFAYSWSDVSSMEILTAALRAAQRDAALEIVRSCENQGFKLDPEAEYGFFSECAQWLNTAPSTLPDRNSNLVKTLLPLKKSAPRAYSEIFKYLELRLGKGYSERLITGQPQAGKTPRTYILARKDGMHFIILNISL